MKCQILISGKYKKNIINLLSAELAQRKVKVNSIGPDKGGYLVNIFLISTRKRMLWVPQ